MNAVVIKAFGGPEVFEQREVPKPAPRSKQVLVRLIASSVNPLVYQIRRGDYKAYVKLPAIIGFDVSGIIEVVGDAVIGSEPSRRSQETTSQKSTRATSQESADDLEHPNAT
jgi:NADPH:quinone reductase